MNRYELLFNSNLQHEWTKQPESSVVERIVLAFKLMPQFRNQDGSYKKTLLKEPKEQKTFCNKVRRTLGAEIGELIDGVKFSIISSKFFLEDGETLSDESILVARRLFNKEHPFTPSVEALIKKYGSLNCLEVLGDKALEEFLGLIDFPFSTLSNLVSVFGGTLTENSHPVEYGVSLKSLEKAVVGTFIRTDRQLQESNWVTIWTDSAKCEDFKIMPYSEYCKEVLTSKRGA